MIGKKINKENLRLFFLNICSKLPFYKERKQSSVLKFDMSVSGYKSWADKVHVKPVLAGMLVFVFIGGMTLQNVWALFGFGVDAQDSTVIDVPELSSSVPLVSLIIQDELLEEVDNWKNPFTIKELIDRYEKSIEASTGAEVVRVVVSKDIQPKDIWEGNAQLYFNGHPDVEGASHLIGTILLGEIPLPVVEKRGSIWVTPYPYTDFKDSVYGWDETKERFVYSGEGDFSPELWHGIINHTLLEDKTEKEKKEALYAWLLTNYISHGKEVPGFQGDTVPNEYTNSMCPVIFTEHEDTGTSLKFKKEGLVNDVSYGKKVLVIDQDIVRTGIEKNLETRYNLFMDNIDDVVYLRQNKHWTKEVMDSITKSEADFTQTVAPDSSGFNLLADNQTKFILDTLVQHYETYFGGYISKINSSIEQAGKYNTDQIDTTMGLVTQVDLGSALLVKNLNTAFEGYLLRMFHDKKIARDINVFTHEDWDNDGSDELVYWNGVRRDQLTVEDCSLLRGFPRKPGGGSSDAAITTQMAEMNRVFNDKTSGQCGGGYAGCCVDNIRISTAGDVSYANCNVDRAVRPIFDLAGGAERFTGKIGAEGCENIISTIDDPEDEFGIEIPVHTFNSFMIHDEPRVETIAAQVKNQNTFAIPIDNPRGVSFYDDDYDFYRFDFIDWFHLRAFATKDVLRKEFVLEMSQVFTKKIDEFNTVLSNNGGGGSISSAPLGEVGKDYLKLFQLVDGELDLGENGNIIYERLQWLNKSLQKKHLTILETIFGQGDKAGVNSDESHTLLNVAHPGYEMILYSTRRLEDGNVMVTAEYEEKEPTESHLDFVIEDNSYQETYFSPPIEVLGHRFDTGLSGYGAISCDGDLSIDEKLACRVQNQFKDSKNTFYADGSFVSANEITPLVDSLEIVLEHETISLLDKNTQKIEVLLKDKNGAIIKQDSETKVELIGGVGYNVGPFKEVQAQQGKATFWLAPKKERQLGKEFFQAQVRIGGKTVLSKKVSIEALPYQLRATVYSEPTVFETEGIEVHARVIGDGYRIQKEKAGKVLFTSEKGEFIGENPATVIEGRASIRFVPPIQAGDAEIQVHFVGSEDVASSAVLVDVAPGKPQVLTLKDRPSLFVEPLTFVPVTVITTDIYGNDIESKQSYEWTIENGVFESTVATTFTQKDILGDATVFIRPLETGKDVFIQVKSFGLSSDQGKRIKIPFKQDLVIEKVADAKVTFLVGDTAKQTIPFTLPGIDEGVLRLPVKVNNTNRGTFPSEVEFKNGKGVLTFYASNESGDVTVSIGGNGVIPLSFDISFLAKKAVRIQVDGVESMAEDEEWIIKAVDEYGNVDTDFPVHEIKYSINKKDDREDLDATADLLLESGVYKDGRSKIIKALEQQNKQGEERVPVVKVEPSSRQLKPGERIITLSQIGSSTGNEFFAFTHPDLVTKTKNISVESGEAVSGGAVKAQAIFALGWRPDDSFMADVLMNDAGFCTKQPESQVQAFVTVQEDHSPKAQYGFIAPNGYVSERLSLQLSVADQYRVVAGNGSLGRSLVSIEYPQEKEAKSSLKIKTERSDVSFNSNEKFLVYKNQPVLEWNANGGIVWMHDKVSVEFPNNNIFEWNVYWDYRHLASVEYEAKSTLHEVFLDEEERVIDALHVDVLIDRIDATVQPVIQGDLSPYGVVLRSLDETEPLDRQLGFVFDSIEDDGESIANFFEGNWKPGVLFSAGNTIGDSTRLGSSDNMIVYGDPTTHSYNENDRTSLEITSDIGSLLYTFGPDIDIDTLIDLDLNADGLEDLVVFTEESISILYQDSLNKGRYLDPQPFLKSDLINTKSVMGADFDEDGKEDLIALHKDGQIFWYKNIGNRLEEPEVIYISEAIYPIKSFKPASLDGGLRNDIVLEDTDSQLWGALLKKGEIEKVIIFDSFAPEFKESKESFSGLGSSLNEEEYPIIDQMSVQFDGIEKSITSELFSYKPGEEVPFTPVLNADIWTRFSIGASAEYDSVQTNSLINIRLDFEIKKRVNNITIQVPGLYNIDYNPGSWSCNGCNETSTVVLGADYIEFKSEYLNARDRIEITWNGLVSSIDGLRYMVDDFSGNDGIDDVAVAKIIDGQEKIIQFTSGPSGVANRKTLVVSSDPSFIAPIKEKTEEGVKKLIDIKNNTQTQIIKPIEEKAQNSLQQLEQTINGGIKPLTDIKDNAQAQVDDLLDGVNGNIKQLFEQSSEHLQSTVAAVSRIDLPTDPTKLFGSDFDGDGIPQLYDLVPKAKNMLNPSQFLETIQSGVSLSSVGDLASVGTTLTSNFNNSLSAIAENAGPLSSGSAEKSAVGSLLEQGNSTVVQESKPVQTKFSCGDPRCGNTTESSAPIAPGATTVKKYPEASPGSVGSGTATYWLPPPPYATQLTSSLRLYQGSTNTGKAYTAICLGDEPTHLVTATWNPNCSLFVIPTTAGPQSCGASNSSTAQLGAIESSVNYLADQANNLFANDQGTWNKGEQKAESSENKNLIPVGGDVLSTFVQNQIFALGRWKLPKLNVFVAKLPETENVLKEVNPYQNIQDSGFHHVRTNSIVIPYPKIDKEEVDIFTKEALAWTQANEKWAESVEFAIRTGSAEPVSWGALLTHAARNREVLLQNVDTVNNYLRQKEGLLDMQDALKEVVKETQKNQDAIGEIYLASLEQLLSDVKPWLNYRKYLERIFSGWEVYTKKLDSFIKTCSNCAVTRTTLIGHLINDGPLSVGIDGFEKDGAASVFQLASRPPDMTLDMSRIVQGNNVAIPQVTLHPVELALTNVPVAYPSLRAGQAPPGIEDIIPLPLVNSTFAGFEGVPSIRAEFPRILASRHTADELKESFVESGQSFIAKPPTDFVQMQKKMTSLMKVHTANFGTLCQIMRGTSYIPEWFVRPNIELVTGRQRLLPKDFGSRSRNKIVEQKSTEDRVQVIDFNLEVSGKDSDDFYARLNATVYTELEKMKCLVSGVQHSTSTKATKPFYCNPVIASASDFLGKEKNDTTNKELFVYDYEKEWNNSIQISEKEALLDSGTFKGERFLASLLEKGESKEVPSSWSASVKGGGVLQHQEPGTRTANLFFYNKKNGFSDVVTTYKLDRKHAGLNRDMNGDGFPEVFVATKGEIYMKTTKVETEKPVNRYQSLSISEDVFVDAHAPLNESWSISERETETELVLKKKDVPDGYIEWQQYPELISSETNERTGIYTWKNDQLKKIVVNPIKIKRVKGTPIIKSKAVPLSLHSVTECKEPENQVQLKEGSMLLGAVGTSRMLWVDIFDEIGEIILKPGETLMQSEGAVCATSGQVYLYHKNNSQYETVLTESTPLVHDTEIITEKGEIVDMTLSNGFNVTIPENQLYTLLMYEENNTPAFLRVKKKHQGITYGQLLTATKEGISTSQPTGIHQVFLENDVTGPEIVLDGGSDIRVNLYTPIVLDANKTTDNTGIESVWWDLDGYVDSDLDGKNGNDNDFPGWTDTTYSISNLLKVEIPGQSAPDTKQLTLFVRDKAGNTSQKVITIEFIAPSVELNDSVVSTDTLVRGVSEINGDDTIAELWRSRNDAWTLIDDEADSIAGENISWKDISQKQGILLEDDLELKIEILENGRPVIETGDYSVVPVFATSKQPFGLVIKEGEDLLGGVVFQFDKEVSIHKLDHRPSTFEEGITLWNSQFFWREIENSPWGEGSMALVDGIEDKTLAIVTSVGQVYAIESGLVLALSPANDALAPLEFTILDEEGIVLGNIALKITDTSFSVLQ